MDLNDNNIVEVLSELVPYIEADGGWLEYIETERNLDEATRMYYGVKEGEWTSIMYGNNGDIFYEEPVRYEYKKEDG